jgi:hypothetical protein
VHTESDGERVITTPLISLSSLPLTTEILTTPLVGSKAKVRVAGSLVLKVVVAKIGKYALSL